MTPNNFTKTGATIDYTPTGGETGKVEVLSTVTGGTTATTFSKEEDNVDWKIWGEDDDNIYLISSKPTAKKLPLKGADGYNNGVWYNDKISSEIFGTTEYERSRS